MQIEREPLLNQLESVSPGLAAREIVEQSTCFVFDGKHVMSFNDEVYCRCPCALQMKGAVQAKPLIELLSRLPSETVDIEVKDAEIVVKAGQRSSGVRMERDVLLPVDDVKVPTKWKTLPPIFGDAIHIVGHCASSNEQQHAITCVHITKEYIETCDNMQLCRFDMDLPVRGESLVRADNLQHMADLGMTQFAESNVWFFFRNPLGLVFACRKTKGTYPSLDELLQSKGDTMVLPKGLVEAAGLAGVFSSENADNDNVTVKLTPQKGGRLVVRGEGASGWYRERKRIKYSGPRLEFRIPPKLLIELTQRHNECEVTDTLLIVNGGRFKYLTSLGATNE